MTSISDLIERVRAAEGPDRELDRLIFVVLFDGLFWPKNAAFFTRDCFGAASAVRFTASIDAALSLAERMLPGAKRSLVETMDGWLASVLIMDDAAPGAVAEDFESHAPSAPLAIVLATLTALQQQAEQTGAIE